MRPAWSPGSRRVVFIADTCALPASGLFYVQEVGFLGPPWHRLASTKTTTLLDSSDHRSRRWLAIAYFAPAVAAPPVKGRMVFRSSSVKRSWSPRK